MAIKEPKFMQELHKIRAQMAREWKNMSAKEIVESLHESGRWLKSQIALSRSKKAHR